MIRPYISSRFNKKSSVIRIEVASAIKRDECAVSIFYLKTEHDITGRGGWFVLEYVLHRSQAASQINVDGLSRKQADSARDMVTHTANIADLNRQKNKRNDKPKQQKNGN